MPTIYTIGYTQKTLEHFIRLLQEADVDFDTAFAAGAVAADAASRGLNVVIVATADLVGRVTAPLQESSIPYRVSNPAGN